MAFLDLLKEIFTGPHAAFKKLLEPNYLASQRARMSTEEYARWMRKQYAYYGSMAITQKMKGLPVPPSWIDGMRMLEDEMDRLKQIGALPGAPRGNPTEGKRISDELR